MQYKRQAIVLAALLILQLQILIQPTSCQDSDGEEQFENYQHEDIGRISGGASQQVAPTPNRQLAIATGEPTSLRAPHHQHHHQQQQQQQHVAPAIRPAKANRITLVPKRDPDFAVTASFAASQPALVTPPQQQHQFVAAQLPASVALAQPNFEPLVAAKQHLQPLVATSAPAPTAFRSNGGSISARHSALMAQVAAERAAVGALEQPSLGSPIEAPAQQAAVQVVQAPPQLHNHHHHNQHQNPASAAQASSFVVANQAHNQASHQQLVDRPEEPLVAPSFEQVLGGGCPSKGVFSYENKDHCDRYYLCTNGTFTEEACPNGLAYSQLGAVYQHCAYQWNVDCGRKKAPEPIASPGCPWQFGIFPIVSNGQCSIDYFVCEWGVPETRRCKPEGLFYDDRIKGCQWADQLGCKSEALLNFKCPAEDEENPYWPYPRYYHNTQNIIVCVNEQPRLVHCTEEQLVDPSSLACVDVKKKKKKF